MIRAILPGCCGSIRRSSLTDAGIAYVFRQFVEPDLKRGALLVLLEKNSQPRGMFHIYYPSSRQMPGKLRVFIDHIRAANRRAAEGIPRSANGATRGNWQTSQ